MRHRAVTPTCVTVSRSGRRQVTGRGAPRTARGRTARGRASRGDRPAAGDPEHRSTLGRSALGRHRGRGHDRGPDRAGHAHGRRPLVSRRASQAAAPGGPHRPRLHQPAPADTRRIPRPGVREGRARTEGAGRGAVGVQHRGAALLQAALDGSEIAYLQDGERAHREAGPLVRVREDWCGPFPGRHLHFPSRRGPEPARPSRKRRGASYTIATRFPIKG